MMITIEGKYQTRDGRAVRILAVGIEGNLCMPVIGLVTNNKGFEAPMFWTPEGHAHVHLNNLPDDLIPVPTKHEGWVVLFCGEGDDVFSTEQAALNWLRQKTRTGRIAHVTWED